MPFDDASPIRRLHQIHVALFMAECAAFDVTPMQYSIVSAVKANPGLDLATLVAAGTGRGRAALRLR